MWLAYSGAVQINESVISEFIVIIIFEVEILELVNNFSRLYPKA